MSDDTKKVIIEIDKDKNTVKVMESECDPSPVITLFSACGWEIKKREE